MGNRGSLDWHDVEIKNEEAFKDWLKDDTIPDHILKCAKGDIENYKVEVKWLKEALLKVPSNESLVDALLSALFDDTKVIGYWYTGTCLVLRELAMFLTGDARVIGEGDDGVAVIRWEEGEASVDIGTLEWHAHTFEELAGVPELPDEIKLVRTL